ARPGWRAGTPRARPPGRPVGDGARVRAGRRRGTSRSSRRADRPVAGGAPVQPDHRPRHVNVLVNGRAVELEPAAAVDRLLGELGLEGPYALVERNGAPDERERYSGATRQAGRPP